MQSIAEEAGFRKAQSFSKHLKTTLEFTLHSS